MKIKIFLAMIVLVFVAFAWQAGKRFLLQDSCLDQGGQWVSNGDYCIS